VPSLKVTLPTFPGRYPWELQYTPMTAESRDIVFIIIQRGFLKRARKKDEMVVIYVVGEQDVRQAQYGEDGWQAELLEFE
jgi:hypothetical protein